MISIRSDPCCDRKRKSYDTTFGNNICEGEIEKQHQLGRLIRHEQYGNWAHIGADLLEYIQKKLPLADILRCRGVCSWWRSVTKTHLSTSLPKRYPPLIIWNNEIVTDQDFSWCFVDVLRTNTSDGSGGGNLYFPNTKSEELLGLMGDCVGSSPSSNGGYLLFTDRVREETLYLFHPMLFSGSALHLPLIRNPSGKVSIRKAVLWGDPISDTSSYYGLVALHLYGGPPLFAKCGATQFTPLECHAKDHFLDIMCVKNRIYGLTDNFNFYVWDCTTCIGSSSSSHVPRLVLEFESRFSRPHPPSTRGCLCLVESEEEMLLVVINTPSKNNLDFVGGTITSYNKVHPICEVYKMLFNNKEWERIYSLGDRVLFAMECQSMSLSSRQFPQYQSNSIYYCHSLPIRGEEPSLGIFNMEDGSLELIDAELG